MEELKQDLLNKEVTLLEMHTRLGRTGLVYEICDIWDTGVLEEEVLAYTLVDDTDMCIYVNIEFTHTDMAQPWLSTVVVKDLYVM